MHFLQPKLQQQQQQHSSLPTTTTPTGMPDIPFQNDGTDRRVGVEEEDDAESAGAQNGRRISGGALLLIELLGRHLQRVRATCGVGAFECYIHRQIFYAQCMKLIALFAVAVAHLLFLYPFLDLFSRLEKYVSHLDFSADAELVHRCVHDLADYKKNVWMTVAVLCVGLSTSSFFLFLLPTSVSPVRKCYILLIGLIDLISFGCLPALFFARVAIIRRVQSELGQALEQAHRLNSAEALMNEIKCTIHPREKLPFCSELILRALISNDLVKFLLVLCALTLAYLAVAYLIYWCIKHWTPHSSTSSFSSSSPLCHSSGTGSCKLCPCFTPQLIVDSSSDRRKKRNMIKGGGAIAYSPLGGGGAGSRRSSASASSTASVPKFFAYSPALPRAAAPPPAAVPAATTAAALSLMLVMPNNALATLSEQCSPVASSMASTASSTVLDELIPSEPVPTAHGQYNNNQ